MSKHREFSKKLVPSIVDNRKKKGKKPNCTQHFQNKNSPKTNQPEMQCRYLWHAKLHVLVFQFDLKQVLLQKKKKKSTVFWMHALSFR